MAAIPDPPSKTPSTASPARDDVARVSVRDAARNLQQQVPQYETNVQVVENLPELGVTYVQNTVGTRFAVDNDTEGHEDLVPGLRYRALVTALGHALKVTRLDN